MKDVLRIPKYVPRWGSAMNPFPMGSQIKFWHIHVKMGVPEVIGSDVPNFVKDVPNFVKDVPWVPKCDPKWGSTPNHFVMCF